MSDVSKLLKGMEKKYALYSVLSPVTMIGEVLMETTIPIVMGKIVDEGIGKQNLPYVLQMGGVMVLMALVSLICGVLGARFSAVASTGFARNVRRNLFTKIQEFSFGNVDHFSSSSLVTRLTTDVTNVQNTYQMLIRIFIRAPFMLISGTIYATMINHRLANIFYIAIPILVFFLAILGTLGFKRFKVLLTYYDSLNNNVQENLSGIRVVKSFVRTDYESEKFKNIAEKLRIAQVRAEKLIILTMPLMQALIYSCILASLWFGGRMIVVGDMTTGELISFVTYIGQILVSLMIISMIFIMIILSKASISRIVEVLNEESLIKNPENPVMKVENGSVEFDNVYFSYNNDKNNCVLENVNLDIESGKMIGIIGSTGSSKSTLISMIPRLYDVIDGSVKVGGVDVRNYDLEVLRDEVAVVLQKNVLFSGTIKENLKWGNENATDEQIKAACVASDAYEFISTMPDGFETELGQGGVNLSGGQKQRLCIARALLKEPKILILDDSTSAVDTATDSRIRKALRESLPDATKIIIAQRINSVCDADEIIVLDNGKINGRGTHEQLLATNKIYQEVYNSQQSEN